MKRILVLLLFVLPALTFGQFRIVGTGLFTTLNDSTYRARVEFRPDLTGNSYNGNQLDTSMLVLSQAGQLYRLDSFFAATSVSAWLVLVEEGGNWGSPRGQIMVFQTPGKYVAPQAVYAANGATAAMQAGVDTWNAKLLRQIADSTSIWTESYLNMVDSIRFEDNAFSTLRLFQRDGDTLSAPLFPIPEASFIISGEGTATEGKLIWNTQSGTLHLGMAGGIEMPIGQGEAHIVRNVTGTNIPKGKVVYISGATGQRPQISLADADGELSSSVTFGVTAEAINNNDSGFVFTSGYIQGINTSLLISGEALWLDTVPGGFTHTKPVAPVHSVLIGYVITQKNNGTIFVKIQNGYELGELHNVNAENPVNRASLYYNAAQGIWRDTVAAILTSDTSGMLSGYVSFEDTLTSIATKANIASKLDTSIATLFVKYADTSLVIATKKDLTFKLNATDTMSLSNRIDNKLNAVDTASLSNRIDLKFDSAFIIGYIPWGDTTIWIATKKDLTQYQGKLTLTTLGTEGASTLIGNTLNIPNYVDTSVYNADGTLLGNRTINLGNNTLTVRAATSANQYVRILDKALKVVDATGTLFETTIDPSGVSQVTGTSDARIDMVGGAIQIKGEDAVTLGGSASDLSIGSDGIVKFRKSASGPVDSLYGKNASGELTTIKPNYLSVPDTAAMLSSYLKPGEIIAGTGIILTKDSTVTISSPTTLSSSTAIIDVAELIVDGSNTLRLPWDGVNVVGIIKTGLYLTSSVNDVFVQHELIPNGNKGDVTSSSGGATIMINDGAVTNSKINISGIQDTARHLIGIASNGRPDTIGLDGGLVLLNGTLTVTGLAGGTVTSITAGTGLTGGTINSSGTIAADLNVLMELSDTVSLSNRINSKLDSLAGEVTTFLVRDTAITTGKIATGAVTNNKVNFEGIEDTAKWVLGLTPNGVPDTVGLEGGLVMIGGKLSVIGASGGTVTSVQLATGTSGSDVNITGTNPITTSGVITLNIPTASSTNRGVLSSANWTTFNNKQNAITLTTNGSSGSATFSSNTLNIPTYTLSGLGGISLSSLSATAPLSYNSGTGAFSISQSSGSVSGFLSFADWTRFNNKLNSDSTLNASRLSGTIPSAVLGNSTTHVGTTAIALNRASANQSLTGISSVQLPGATSGTVTLQPAATAGTTTITLPATTGTVITSGDNGTVTSTMIANGTITNDDVSNSAAIAVSKLAANTISGITLGNNLNTLSMGVSGIGLSGSATYNGSTGSTFTVTSNATNANTANTIVARDASGNFSAGTITASLNGNASTATALQGTLGVSGGGTGLTSITAGRIPVGAGTLAMTTNANLFYDTPNDKLLVGSAWSKRPETLLSRLTVHAGQASDVTSTDNGTVFYYLDQTFMNNAAAFFVSKNVNSPIVNANSPPEPVIILGRPGSNGPRWGSVASFNLSSYGSSPDPNTQLDITLAASNTEGSNLRRVMTIRANGTVGINKVEPTEALHVNGKVRIGNTASAPSHLIGLGSDSTIAYLPTATYPSLAELARVKGVTSAIQTQLDGKLSSAAGAVGETNLASGAVTGTKVAITGITNHPTRLVGAHSNGNLDTIAVGSGLSLSNGILSSTAVTHYINITAFGATDTIPSALTNSEDFFVVHSGLNGYCIDSYQARARSGTGSIDVQISLNGVYFDAQTVSGTTTVNKNTNRTLSTGDVIQVNTANGSGTLIGLSVTYEIKQTCN